MDPRRDPHPSPPTNSSRENVTSPAEIEPLSVEYKLHAPVQFGLGWDCGNDEHPTFSTAQLKLGKSMSRVSCFEKSMKSGLAECAKASSVVTLSLAELTLLPEEGEKKCRTVYSALVTCDGNGR